VADLNPSPADTGVVANPAKESWTLTFLKVSWPVLAGILVLVSSIVTLFLPDRMSLWMSALPILAGIDAAMGAAAFGGPALKRAQETRAGG
jgi:hypothetical protein